MRKVMSLLLVMVMAVSLCGCEVSDEVTIEKDNAIVSDGDNGENPQGKKISVEEEKERIEKAREAEKAIEEENAQEEPTAEVVEEKTEETVSVTVYKTNTGKKYHREGCQHLKSKIETTLESAKALGLKPCKVCSPPQ